MQIFLYFRFGVEKSKRWAYHVNWQVQINQCQPKHHQNGKMSQIVISTHEAHETILCEKQELDE